MKLVDQAFNELFPGKNLEEYDLKIKYTDKFKPYNANVRYTKNSLQFNLSKRWRKVNKEIQIGLLQGLLLRIFKEKRKTTNIDLYNSFMKNLHISIPKVNNDPILEQSFNKINEEYFFGLIERPNFMWHNSVIRLGSYEYGTDTISMSKVLEDDMNVLDYVMYHEMLHKKHKFHNHNGRNHHHTKEFKEMEKKFANSEELEEKIKGLVRQKRRKRFDWF
jgi:predicted SprT family Zn-dependent metalloprotease